MSANIPKGRPSTEFGQVKKQAGTKQPRNGSKAHSGHSKIKDETDAIAYFPSRERTQARLFIERSVPLLLSKVPSHSYIHPGQEFTCQDPHDKEADHRAFPKNLAAGHCNKHDHVMINMQLEMHFMQQKKILDFKAVLVHEWVHAAQLQSFPLFFARRQQWWNNQLHQAGPGQVGDGQVQRPKDTHSDVSSRPFESHGLSFDRMGLSQAIVLEGSADYVRERFLQEMGGRSLESVHPRLNGAVRKTPYFAGANLFREIEAAAQVLASSKTATAQSLVACAWETLFDDPSLALRLLPKFEEENSSAYDHVDPMGLQRLIDACLKPVEPVQPVLVRIEQSGPHLSASAMGNRPMLLVLPMTILLVTLLRALLPASNLKSRARKTLE